MPRGQTLLSYIEWEDFGHNWKIDTLEPSESLPQGAEKAEVWRNENYELKAKISGTIEGSHIDIHPKVEAGSGGVAAHRGHPPRVAVKRCKVRAYTCDINQI